MASLITHPLVPLVAATCLGRKTIPVSLLLLGIVYSMLPDLDVLGFRMGVPYASPWGHRGFSHSIATALVLALVPVPFFRRPGAKPLAIFSFLAVCMVSHGVLDAYTNKGLGVAFFWPFDNARYFFEFRPVEASPISVRRFMSGHGLEVLRSEFLWIWTPLLLTALVGYFVRMRMHSLR